MSVDVLIKNGADPELTNSNGEAPIHHACQSGKTYVVMMLLDAGASAHVCNRLGDTPLDVAARFDRLEVVSFLIDHDNTVIESTRSLREATKTGRQAVVQLLLDFGMDASAQDEDDQDSALHIGVRFHRYQLVSLLLEYGADPYQKNGKGETPMVLAEQYPVANKNRERILKMIQDNENKEIATPAVEEAARRTKMAQEASMSNQRQQEYPTLKVLSYWTEDKPHFRSASSPGHPVTNILNEADSSSYWSAPGIGRQWVVFDFGSPFKINCLILGGVSGREFPKALNLEVASAMKGPWAVIHTAEVDYEGKPSAAGSPVFHQKFDGFLATSRYWRLQIIRNHGAHETRVNSVSFQGVEHGLNAFFIDNGLKKYYDAFVDAGINQIKALRAASAHQLDKLVKLPGHRRKVQLAIDGLTGNKSRHNRLVFSVQPCEAVTLGSMLPPFEVSASPNLTDEVELHVIGGAEIRGTTRVKLQPTKAGPSIATFDDIELSPPGSFVFEVSFVSQKSISVRADRPTEVEPVREKLAIGALFQDFESLLDF